MDFIHLSTLIATSVQADTETEVAVFVSRGWKQEIRNSETVAEKRERKKLWQKEKWALLEFKLRKINEQLFLWSEERAREEE